MRRVDTVVECLPPDADRPPRTMYALTETGERLARVVVENYDFTPTWWGRLWRRQ
jgi:DNA-binding HxlR family transcriptional regulator